MGEDMRVDQLRARRLAVGCTWLFLAVPGVFGIVIVIANEGRSMLGWVLTTLFLAGTAYLGFLFIHAATLGVAASRGRTNWLGFRKPD